MTTKKELILNIIDGKSVRLRESYFVNHYIDTYNSIIDYTSDLYELPFINKIWHWVNEEKVYKLCNCGKRTKFNNNWLEGYKTYCSAKCVQQNPSTKEKRKTTVLKKYGVDNVSKSTLSKINAEKTCLEKYGTKSSFQNEEVREKWKNTITKKWGVDHYFKTDEFKTQAKKYYLQKWGVDHQSKVDEIQKRIQVTCMNKYGFSTYLNTEHSRSCIRKTNTSLLENEVCNFLNELNITYIKNGFKTIAPYSLDIYIPDFNLALEFNGLYWHSELFKPKNYHLNKTNMCEDLDIQLIHIWEDDWISRKNVIKSILKNKLGVNKKNIYARKCKIVELDNKTVSDFLNRCHIQGYCRFSNAYGLVHNDDLVSVMCFGWRSTNGKREYELIRYCNELNTNVCGGASKLFHNFIKTYKIDSITSYADVSMFNGKLYNKLGFVFSGRTPINYWWVVGGIRRHRFNYNKRKLVKLGHDKALTEVEIMHELGRYRLFGCGQDKWVWVKNEVK